MKRDLIRRGPPKGKRRGPPKGKRQADVSIGRRTVQSVRRSEVLPSGSEKCRSAGERQPPQANHEFWHESSIFGVSTAISSESIITYCKRTSKLKENLGNCARSTPTLAVPEPVDFLRRVASWPRETLPISYWWDLDQRVKDCWFLMISKGRICS